MPIRTRDEYKQYLEADRVSLGITRHYPIPFGDEIWRFQRLLRAIEYWKNCRNSPLWIPYIFLLVFRFHRLSTRLGITIPPNVFGPGLSIAHIGPIVVNGGTRVGANCRIHICVNIGTRAGASDQTPIIGDNVYIGPGAKIFGPIRIADDIAIGANSVVNKSFEEPNITIAGVPAKKISDRGSTGLVGDTEIAEHGPEL